jgi:hypothetical protein
VFVCFRIQAPFQGLFSLVCRFISLVLASCSLITTTNLSKIMQLLGQTRPLIAMMLARAASVVATSDRFTASNRAPAGTMSTSRYRSPHCRQKLTKRTPPIDWSPSPGMRLWFQHELITQRSGRPLITHHSSSRNKGEAGEQNGPRLPATEGGARVDTALGASSPRVPASLPWMAPLVLA